VTEDVFTPEAIVEAAQQFALTPTPISHGDLVEALRNRYAPPHWFLLDRILSIPGFSAHGIADAVAFGLYPSRGFEIHGFEAKVSRSDFLREIAQPDKSSWLINTVDRFYIVAPGPEVARAAELPLRWGLLYVRRWGDGFRVQTARTADLIPAHDKQFPLDRAFVASLLVRMRKDCEDRLRVPADAIARDEHERRVDEARKQGFERCKVQLKRDDEEAQRLRANLAQFEAASGIKIDSYGGGRQGEAFRAFCEAREAFGWAATSMWDRAERGLRDALDAVGRARTATAAARDAAEGKGQCEP
jgi:hypothetical protein